MSEQQEAVNWNFQYQFPTNSNYTNRIKEVKFEDSKSSGNPMVILVCEVISPNTVDVGGQLVNLAGVETKSYYTTLVWEDGKAENKVVDKEATAKCKLRWTSSDPNRLGLIRILFEDEPEYAEQMCQEFDPENPNPDMLKKMVGRCILTAMSSKGEPRRATPTSEELAEAKRFRKPAREAGKIMKHPKTGKELVSYQPNINEIFALAPSGASAGVPY